MVGKSTEKMCRRSRRQWAEWVFRECWKEVAGSPGDGVVSVNHKLQRLVCQMEIQPGSSKGRRVLIGIPVGIYGRGWVQMAEALEKFTGSAVRVPQFGQHRPEGGMEIRAPAVLSYAEVARREQLVRGGEKSSTKWVTITVRFPGEEAYWSKIPERMEMAKSWAATC